MDRILDADTALLVSQIKTMLKDLRSRGVDEDMIGAITRKDDGAGRVVLDRGYLILPDEGKARIRLTPMERTLYIFLAEKKDGVVAADLWKHFDDLCRIYRTQTVYDDLDLISDAVDALCEDDKKTFRTNISRIRKKIADKAGKWASERYGIRRDGDGRYRVDVDLVR